MYIPEYDIPMIILGLILIITILLSVIVILSVKYIEQKKETIYWQSVVWR